MAQISRIVAVGYPHHFKQRGVRSIDIFDSDSDRNTYLQFIKEESQFYEIDVLSCCLMTNHVHFVAVPHKESSFAKGFGEAHKRYTRMKNFSEGVRR
jgi:putative transposase